VCGVHFWKPILLFADVWPMVDYIYQNTFFQTLSVLSGAALVVTKPPMSTQIFRWYSQMYLMANACVQ
jgi:hypothetical protein